MVNLLIDEAATAPKVESVQPINAPPVTASSKAESVQQMQQVKPTYGKKKLGSPPRRSPRRRPRRKPTSPKKTQKTKPRVPKPFFTQEEEDDLLRDLQALNLPPRHEMTLALDEELEGMQFSNLDLFSSIHGVTDDQVRAAVPYMDNFFE